MSLLYVRNYIPEKYNIPLIKEKTLTNLIAKGFNQIEIAKKVGHSNSTVCRSIKGYGINYNRPPSKCKPRPKNNDNDKDKFEIKVKGNYAEIVRKGEPNQPGATVYLYRSSCKYFPKTNHHKRVLVMIKGKLKDTKTAIRWWDEKVEKAWGRRRYYEAI